MDHGERVAGAHVVAQSVRQRTHESAEAGPHVQHALVVQSHFPRRFDGDVDRRGLGDARANVRLLDRLRLEDDALRFALVAVLSFAVGMVVVGFALVVRVIVVRLALVVTGRFSGRAEVAVLFLFVGIVVRCIFVIMRRPILVLVRMVFAFVRMLRTFLPAASRSQKRQRKECDAGARGEIPSSDHGVSSWGTVAPVISSSSARATKARRRASTACVESAASVRSASRTSVSRKSPWAYAA